MTISYTNNIPAGANNPSSDRPIMTTNVNATSAFLAIDHDPFLIAAVSSPAVASGYHTVIHQVTQTSTPGVIPGVNQVFSGNPSVLINPNTGKASGIPNTGETQLFALTGSNGFSQLTGRSNLQNGYCWSGGILFQWGKFTSNGTGLVGFNVVFPNNCFNVQATSTFGVGLVVTAVATTGFAYGPTTASLYWFAIGL